MEKRIHVGAWNAVNEYQTTENDFKEIAKSGMDFIIMSYTRDEKAVENLAWAEKYNVKCLMFDGAINDAEDLTAEKVLELTKPYADSPSFAGFSICDEPDMGRYPHLAQVAKACYITAILCSLKFESFCSGFSISLKIFVLPSCSFNSLLF